MRPMAKHGDDHERLALLDDATHTPILVGIPLPHSMLAAEAGNKLSTLAVATQPHRVILRTITSTSLVYQTGETLCHAPAVREHRRGTRINRSKRA